VISSGEVAAGSTSLREEAMTSWHLPNELTLRTYAHLMPKEADKMGILDARPHAPPRGLENKNADDLSSRRR
jgi:hypothetical protein